MSRTPSLNRGMRGEYVHHPAIVDSFLSIWAAKALGAEDA